MGLRSLNDIRGGAQRPLNGLSMAQGGTRGHDAAISSRNKMRFLVNMDPERATVRSSTSIRI